MKILHQIPGRIRLGLDEKLPALDADFFVDRLSSEPCVIKVSFNPITLSLLVLYDHDQLSDNDMITLIRNHFIIQFKTSISNAQKYLLDIDKAKSKPKPAEPRYSYYKAVVHTTTGISLIALWAGLLLDYKKLHYFAGAVMTISAIEHTRVNRKLLFKANRTQLQSR